MWTKKENARFAGAIIELGYTSHFSEVTKHRDEWEIARDTRDAE
jgi:hypothetical protein